MKINASIIGRIKMIVRILKALGVIFLFIAMWDVVPALKIIATFILIYKLLGVIING